ncbi:MAG: APC family permease [Gammaproteobacteria bacterium]|nr:APC family permease [Gammaproteobacteria bacterium]MDE2345451.1 APC family permease [Gammaproteobacteria bacterium]
MAQGKLRKDAGLVGLLFVGVSTMIGSGWLLGPMHSARDAGPLSIGSWAIAALVVGLIALVYAELGPLFTRSGGLMYMSLITHGRLVGRIWSWILFLAYVSIAPVEAMAVVTYANNYSPVAMVHPQTQLLTAMGVLVAVAVLALLTALNFLVLRLILLLNTLATWIKVCAPIGTIIVLLIYSHHPENLAVAAHASGNVANMLTAISTAGVFFSLFGFTQAIQLAGETENPARNIPIAVIGTIIIGALIFVLVQYAFVTAIPPDILAKGGWSGLSFKGAAGPMAGLAMTLGASFWALALYADAIISPAFCGYIWSTATARMLMASADEKFASSGMMKINRHGVPWVALIVSFCVGLLFFFPFPSWQKLVDYASSATVLSYGLGCVVLLQMRRVMPKLKRPFRLWQAWVIAPLAFIASNFILFWAGFTTMSFLFAILIAALAVYLVFNSGEGTRDWRHALWLIPYFGGMWFLGWIGPQSMGGKNWLNIYWDMLAVAVLSLVILYIALNTSVSAERSEAYYAKVVEAGESGSMEVLPD